MSFFRITVDPPERWDECTLIYTCSDVYDIEVRKLGILRVSLCYYGPQACTPGFRRIAQDTSRTRCCIRRLQYSPVWRSIDWEQLA